MSQPRTHPFYHATFDAAAAALVVIAAVGTLYAVSIVLDAAGATGAIAVGFAELAFVAAPIALCVRWRMPVAVLGLARPHARFVIAAVLVGSALWFVNLRLVTLIIVPEDRALRGLAQQSSLAVTIVMVAIVPAVCEELVFRGVLARGLARRLPALAAIAIAAAAFSIYHLRPVQLVPTFTLGLALGTIAVRGDSAIPTMIGHALNNAIAIVVSRQLVSTEWIAEHPDAVLVASIGVVAAGVALAIPARGAT